MKDRLEPTAATDHRRGEWNVAASPGIHMDDTVAKMKELSGRIRNFPTVFVTMTKTLSLLRGLSEASHSQFLNNALPTAFTGIPIEDYPTMKECMDRIVRAREDERPQLIAAPEDFTVELLDHPYMQTQLVTVLSQYDTAKASCNIIRRAVTSPA